MKSLAPVLLVLLASSKVLGADGSLEALLVSSSALSTFSHCGHSELVLGHFKDGLKVV